jgi:hypothetical protein
LPADVVQDHRQQVLALHREALSLKLKYLTPSHPEVAACHENVGVRECCACYMARLFIHESPRFFAASTHGASFLLCPGIQYHGGVLGRA